MESPFFDTSDIEKLADSFEDEKIIVVPYSIRRILSNNPITKNLYLTHIGYYPNTEGHHRVRTEGCNEFILLYCLDGKGWVKYGDEEVILKKHSLFIIPKNIPHSYGADKTDPWELCWCHFVGEQTNLFNSIIGRKIELKDSDNSRLDDRLSLFDEIYQNLEMGFNQQNLEYATFCLTHFLASIKYLEQFREVRRLKGNDVVQRAISFMKNNLEAKLTLEDIANHVGYTNARFNQVFSIKASTTPMSYYNYLKIQRACSYLQFSDLKIKEIASKLAFYDQFHFSKSFKQQMNMSPKEYRENTEDNQHRTVL